eukprot:1139502-Pelagomonas_calceolata.AAC.12
MPRKPPKPEILGRLAGHACQVSGWLVDWLPKSKGGGCPRRALTARCELCRKPVNLGAHAP